MTRVSSIFSQMLQLFSRTEFERAFVDHRAERHDAEEFARALNELWTAEYAIEKLPDDFE